VGRRPLPEAFFRRPTRTVARALLGCRLVHRTPDGGERALVLVETEAYLGIGDPAAHTFGGRRTARVTPMWGPGGHAYIYFVYGMHHCMNVVTREEGRPEAVLLRAGVPEAWWHGEELSRAELLEGSGPGRLCRALSLTTTLSGASLSGPELFLERARTRRFEVLVGPRVGVDYAGEAASWPLRFAVAGCPAVTRRTTLARTARRTPARAASAALRSP
jgi:DNA-3-methyladenine glycosylase